MGIVHLNLPIYKFTVKEDDDRFLRLELWLAVVGGNLNKSFIDKEAYELAKSTIEYIPLCGKLDDKKEKFLGHELEEKPFGTILDLNNNNYRYETGDNDLEYVVVDAIIFKQYCQEETDVILKDGGLENISIEIDVNDGYKDKKDKLYHITDFTYLCCTVIGVNPGMQGAHLQTYSKAEYSEFIETMKGELSIYFEQQKDKKNVIEPIIDPITIPIIENKDISTEIFSDDINKNNEIKEVDIMSKTKKDIALLFTLTMEQLESEMRKVLCTITYQCVDTYWGEIYTCRKYYLEDYDESFIYSYDSENNIDVKLSYVKQGDDVVIDFTSAKRIKYTPTDWISTTDATGEIMLDEDDVVIDCFSKELKEDLISIYTTKFTEKIKAKDEEIANFTSQIESKDSEFGKLCAQLTSLEGTLTQNKSEFEAKIQEFETTLQEKEAKIAEYAQQFSSKEAEEKLAKVNDLLSKKEFSVFSAEEKSELATKSVDMSLENFTDIVYSKFGKKIKDSITFTEDNKVSFMHVPNVSSVNIKTKEKNEDKDDIYSEIRKKYKLETEK